MTACASSIARLILRSLLKPTSVSPIPTLFLKGYNDDMETTPKQKAPTSREFVTPKMKRQKITKFDSTQDKNQGETSATHSIVSPPVTMSDSFTHQCLWIFLLHFG